MSAVTSAEPSTASSIYWQEAPPRAPMSAAPAPRESVAPNATVVVAPASTDAPISGDIQIVGGEVANALPAIKGMRTGLRACYRRGLKEDPAMRASVQLTLEIGPPGDVTRAKLSTVDGYLSGSVTSCIENRGKNAHFAPPDGGGGKATIVVPLTFAPPK